MSAVSKKAESISALSMVEGNRHIDLVQHFQPFALAANLLGGLCCLVIFSSLSRAVLRIRSTWAK